MKTFGLDLGTNSIGWGVVESYGDDRQLIAKGVHVFTKGVGDGQKGEYSLAAERTGFRSARRLKFRRKLRKIAVLKVLSEHDYCPELTTEELLGWRNKKVYPESKAFREWLKTDDVSNKNPYYYRNLAAELKLDLNDRKSRHLLGRAFYHLAQRRGFKSNALEEDTKESGKVKEAIGALQKDKGDLTLGQFFYKKFYGQHGKLDKDGKLQRIRNNYTDREQDYVTEFNFICDKQQVPENLRSALYRELFFQRPLKSQKGNIAKCPFEPTKQRAPISHPLYERYRMFQFINNIKIKTPDDEMMRCLNGPERKRLEKEFYINDAFKFEKIVKALVPKKAKAGYYRDCDDAYDYLFNYRLNSSVASCPAISKLMNVFGCSKGDYPGFLDCIAHKYINSAGKTPEECLIDVWHVLFTFDDAGKRIEFGKEKLGLAPEAAEQFNKIKFKQDYGQLSIKAIRNFMPLLEKGMLYSHAAFLANIPTVMNDCEYDPDELNQAVCDIIDGTGKENQVIDAVNALIKRSREDELPWNYNAETIDSYRGQASDALRKIAGAGKWSRLEERQRCNLVDEVMTVFAKQQASVQSKSAFLKKQTILEKIKDYLKENFGVGDKELEKIYHPSAIEAYRKAEPDEEGNLLLADPRISSIKNPVFMRTMYRLRALVNELLRQGIIDRDTRVNIEMARELNDGNMRKAIYEYQHEKEKERIAIRDRIREFYQQNNINREPDDTDILKYQLWQEQKEYCPYTDRNIGLTDIFGSNPAFDIEHTFPRSRSCDNSRANLTLTEKRYNRDVKRNKIPAELPDYNKILQRVESFGWREGMEALQKRIDKIVPSLATTKEQKDGMIVKRHKLTMERDYYREKLFRFTAQEIPERFVARQLVDTRIICKYAKMYLETVFERVYSYKAQALKPFYKLWGLDDKKRDNQLHHCVDAIIAACITRNEYDAVAKFYHELDEHELDGKPKPDTAQPWPGFARDLNVKLKGEVVVTSFQPDKLLKKAKKKVRKRGKIEHNNNGDPKYMKGASARGSLHKDTFYGAVKTDGYLKHVVRKKLEDLKSSDIKNIVDPVVQKIIDKNKNKIGKEVIWFNEEKKIPVRKVRVFTPAVKTPVLLKEHTHLSEQEYKQHYRVVNDGNYALAIYGHDRGPIKDKDVISLLDAASFSHDNEPLFPEFSDKGVPLRAVLKIGSRILLYRNSPDELYDMDKKDLSKRLYKITGIEGVGRVKLLHHQAVSTMPVGDANIDYDMPKERLYARIKQFFVENVDFKMDILGNISFME